MSEKEIAELAKELWMSECCIGPDGVAVFHVESLEEALRTNALQVVQGWTAGYVPFALCASLEMAHANCEAMRQLQFEHAKTVPVEERLPCH